MTPRDVKAKLDRKDDFVLLDVREPYEVEMASIPGAVVIPSDDVPARAVELPKDKEVVVFCHHGGRAAMAAFILKRKGFGKVAVMAGGIDAWSLQVDPSVPRYES
jgi:adenylyltransferase/sulfurtransferase